MKVEVVTVCVGYADFLRETLVQNLPLVDNLVVVTSPDDKETQEVCRRHSVHFVMSDDHKRDGAAFNKARLIQRGFDQIGMHDWVLHLDADIILPRKFRQYLDWAHLDPKVLYGADRCNLVGFDAWQRMKQYAGGWDNHAHEVQHWFHGELQVGARWVSKIHGYVPIGFCQLAHGSTLVDRGYHIRNYRLDHGDAARTDIQFALQFDRRHRQILPEVVVLHLESSNSKCGANWAGRTTARFGPAAPKEIKSALS